MADLTATNLASPVFEGNLAALRARQPELAQRVRDASLPPEARLVAGRDGSPVVRLAATAKEVRWLGGSSMPTVSTPAALAGFVDQGVSIAMPTVGTGYEPAALARRMPKHCAVYVCEP